MQFRIAQARSYKFNLVLRRGDALFCFLLECVQDVNHTGKSNGVNGPVRVAVEILDQFQDGTLYGWGQ